MITRCPFESSIFFGYSGDKMVEMVSGDLVETSPYDGDAALNYEAYCK